MTCSKHKTNPCSRVLFKKLIVAQWLKKFLVLYGIGRFLRLYTNAQHYPESALPRSYYYSSLFEHPINAVFTSTSMSPKLSLSLRFLADNFVCFSSHAFYMHHHITFLLDIPHRASRWIYHSRAWTNKMHIYDVVICAFYCFHLHVSVTGVTIFRVFHSMNTRNITEVTWNV
jgi:hypothetical protein